MTKDPSHSFVDYVRIHVNAGDGGNGAIHFRREKFVEFGGPDGGDGGRGGSIYLEADDEMLTLLDFKYRHHHKAKDGQDGGPNQRSGKSGDDIVLRVPLGTTVSDADTDELVGDLTRPGERLLVAKGGDGGRGNQHFATSTNRAPRKAERGWPGDERNLVLELKLIADAGLVGLPNAGKSTLLSVMTHATPKIAAYPFTTLHPNLGVFLASDYQRRIVLADIPGLIEGAHSGIGLGDKFLRHIERTSVLVHLVAPESGTTAEGKLTEADANPETLLYAYELVEQELAEYSGLLRKKTTVACLSKIDLLSEEEVSNAVKTFAEKGIELLPISATDGRGLDELKARIEKVVMEEEAHRIELEEEAEQEEYRPPKRLIADPETGADVSEEGEERES